MALKQELSQVVLKDLLDRTSDMFKTVNHYQTSPEKPIHISTSLTIQQALQLLSENHISSAPIYDSEAKEFIGSLEYSDLVGLVLGVLQNVPLEQRQTIDWVILLIDSWRYFGEICNQGSFVANYCQESSFTLVASGIHFVGLFGIVCQDQCNIINRRTG